MLLIFCLSSQVAEESSQLSNRVTEIIIETIGRFASLDVEAITGANLGSGLNYLVRKSAHFTAYFILSILLMNAFIVSGFKRLRALIFTIIVCILYAISDEVHQLFVPGRSGEVRDVLIDSVGATIGAGAYLIMGKIKKVMVIK